MIARLLGHLALAARYHRPWRTLDPGVSKPLPRVTPTARPISPTATKPARLIPSRAAITQGILRKPTTSPPTVKGKLPKIRDLYLLPAAQSAGQGDLVGQLDVGPHPRPAPDARDLAPPIRT